MKKYFLSSLLLLASQIFSQKKPISGFTPSSAVTQHQLEAKFDEGLNREHIGELIKRLSGKPHNVGSQGSKENAEFISSQYKQWGWDTKIETFKVLFPTPTTRILEMIAPTSYK